ncbi:MAG: hypothetical protein ABIC82_05335 [bacterium]
MTLKDRQNLIKIEKLLLNWEEACCTRQIDEDESKIKVNKMVKKLGLGYEGLRIIVDGDRGHNNCYKAIRRILIRLILMEKRKPENVPRLLIEELIRGDFLENNKLPKSDIKIVWRILDKYIVLMNNVSVKISQTVIGKKISKRYANKKKKEINKWLFSLAAREIEKFLAPKKKEEVITKCMYEYIAEQIDIDDSSLSEQEKKIQIYIAVQRAFLQSDNGTLSYYLFNLECPNWSNCDEYGLDIIAKKIFTIQENVERRLKHPINQRLQRICGKYAVYFIILSDILNKIGAAGFAKLLKDKPELEKQITETVEGPYKKAKKRVRRGLVSKTLYVFITKSVMVKYPGFNFNFSNLELLGVLFAGPIIMVAVGFSIMAPPKKNTKKIIKVFNRMFFENRIRTAQHEVKQVSFPLIKNTIFTIIYLATFAVVIFGIYVLLNFIGFRPMTTSIILFFFSMIAYFGFCLRAIVRAYVVLDYEENFIGFMFDFISLPILTIGKSLAWIANEMNISRWILDYIIEVPCKTFINFFEHWTLFIREKKEDLQKGDY